MSAPTPERTPEQLRRDRRASAGCGIFVLLCAVGFLIAGITTLHPHGTRTQARILSCPPRVIKQPFHCNGIWSVNGRFQQGFVDGATSGDVGKKIEVRAHGHSATVVRGKLRLAIVAFVLAAACLWFGVVIVRSMRR